jgi:gamma-glutamylcyclotransferase (GGCT)/AIG2-like uncharacterized protein YtfP
MPHLFAYGTLMFPEVWRIVVGREFETTLASLVGYEILRVQEAVYPGILRVAPSGSSSVEPRAASAVPGLVYFDLDASSLARLDAFEGPEYVRQTVVVVCQDGGEVEADAYVVPRESAHLLTDEVWTADDFAARGHLATFVAKYAGFGRLEFPAC